ncbi:MAG TPA: outer membrane beta-barrel protein [Candidatus Acidoferrum sp.]|nr:outer membrane beta-barrel protein [Candidatus Acidoferrum sp.]
MKKQVLIGLLAVGLVICLTGASAHAQDSKMSVFAGYSFGTSNNGCQFEECFDPTLHGYAASFTYNFNRHFALEANFSGRNGDNTLFSQPVTSSENGENFFERQDMYFYTFGPRLTMPVGKFSIYTHFLVGAATIHTGTIDKCILSSTADSECFSTETSSAHGTGFALKVGGGADWNHGRWGIQILEVNFIRTEIQTTANDCVGCTPFMTPFAANNVELTTGVKFNFGGKNQ